MPLASFQVSSLEDRDEVTAAFADLGFALRDPDRLVERFRSAARDCLEENAWTGIECGGQFFAWEGVGLAALEDRNDEPTPPGLIEALTKAGWRVSYALPKGLDRVLAKGGRPVYMTDRRTWRRRLSGVGGEQVLVVKRGGMGN